MNKVISGLICDADKYVKKKDVKRKRDRENFLEFSRETEGFLEEFAAINNDTCRLIFLKLKMWSRS